MKSTSHKRQRASSQATSLTTMIAVIGMVLTSGCAGLHLYNEANHELAQNAETKFRDASVSEGMNEEKELLDQLLDDELALLGTRMAAQRDHNLMALINHPEHSGSWAKLSGAITNRMNELAPHYGAIDILDALIDYEESKINLLAAADTYSVEQKKDPTKGPALDRPISGFGKHTPPLDSNPVIHALYSNYVSAHSVFATNQTAVKEALSQVQGSDSVLGSINDEIRALEMANKAVSAARIEWKRRHSAALKNLGQASQSNNESAVTEALEEIHELLKDPSKFDQANQIAAAMGVSGGLLEKLEEQRRSIAAIFDAFVAGADGEVDDDDMLNGGAAKARDLWYFLQDLNTSLEQPQIASLILEAERVRLELDRHKKRERRLQNQMNLLEAKREAAVHEWELLDTAWQAMSEIRELSKDQDASLFESFKAANLDQRILMAHALMNYANSWSDGRLRQKEIDVRLIAERHAGALENSQNSLEQWETLINQPLTQLVAFHASGLTAEEIAAALNAAGLGAIGFGTN